MALERFDRSHETHRQWDPRGELMGPQPEEKVSAYIVRHLQAGRLFVGCEGSEPALGYAVGQVGSEPWLYSSDFPHEVNNEFCRAEIEEILESPALADAAKAAVLHGNAERFYALAPATSDPASEAATLAGAGGVSSPVEG
jgi:predicted TIM-barrel fold metal-dependent hydrolase